MSVWAEIDAIKKKFDAEMDRTVSAVRALGGAHVKANEHGWHCTRKFRGDSHAFKAKTGDALVQALEEAIAEDAKPPGEKAARPRAVRCDSCREPENVPHKAGCPARGAP